LSETDQRSLIATLKWTGSPAKVGEWVHRPHAIRAQQSRFAFDATAMPSTSSACSLYADGAAAHQAVWRGPPSGAGACSVDVETAIPIGADRNYQICGTYCWYVDPRKSERDQFYQILEIVRDKLLQPQYGGLENPLIRVWLAEKNLLELFAP
jgi:hypothetical protein